MNKEIIHKAISNPEVVLPTSIEDLEKISEQYPYFATAQLLLTKAYQRTGNYRYTDQLHQAAIYSTDRNHLYQWLKASMNPSSIAPVTSSESSVKTILDEALEVQNTLETTPIVDGIAEVVPSTPNTQDQLADLVSLMLTDELVSKPSELTDSQAPVVTATPQQTLHTAEPTTGPSLEQETTEAKTNIPTDATASISEEIPTEIQQEQVTPASNIETNSIYNEAEVSETGPHPALYLDDVEKEILLEAMHSSIEMEVSPSPELEIEETRETPSSSTADPIEEDVIEEEDIPAEPTSYAEWIYLRSRQIHFATNETTNETQQTAAHVSKSESIDEITEKSEESEESQENTWEEPARHLSHGIRKLSPSSTKNSQQQLIDRFIQFEPKITPGKALEYTAGNLAKESLEEDFSFVTETMAILFAKQGKPDKARKAYKKLIEQFPEKSVYFAAQLKNLDKYKK